MGYDAQNFDGVVAGIVAAIQMYSVNFSNNISNYHSLSVPTAICVLLASTSALTTCSWSQTSSMPLRTCNITSILIVYSRSPTAYLANPLEERALYPEGDTDKNMTLVKMVDANGNPFGSIAWVRPG